ncbi:MAG: 30S ribosomal protein S16 [Armatimonadota bacterium]|nr:30S ribosomal protein S16 [bacterium]
MVKIRLRRMGAKKRPFYRIVAADSRTARDGRFIEILGFYDPTQDPPEIKINRERIEYWLGTGAQPSDTTRGLLKTQGFLGGPTPKKAKAKVKEPAAAEATE